MAVAIDWKDVSTDVEAVFKSFLVGKHIMARATRMLELGVVDTKISELMDGLLEADVINKKLVDELKEKFIDSMKARESRSRKATRRGSLQRFLMDAPSSRSSS